MAPLVEPQSVDDDSSLASATSFSFSARATSRVDSSSAKWDLRRRVNEVRAPEKRCHSSSSVALSSRGRPFHSSSRSRSRWEPCRQSDEPATCSAASAISCLRTLARSRASARSFLRAARRPAT